MTCTSERSPRLCNRPGIRQVAADLGVNPETLRNWIRNSGAGRGQGRAEQSVQPQSPLEAELAAARKKIRELEEERDILRKAARYFAGETRW
nr:transposase [Streptomyces sp. ISL-86]